MYHSLLMHLSIDEHLGCFQVLATVNNSAMNIGVQIYLCALLSILGGVYPDVEMLNNMVILFLIFWETNILFSIRP